MKPPEKYHDPDFQQSMIASGTREQLIEWLVWNDPNGIYTDRDSASEGISALTLERAREIMREQVARETPEYE